MAFNTDRSGEEIQVMTPDVITGAVAGDIDVSTYSTVMFDTDQILDSSYMLPANTPFGIVKGKDLLNISANSGVMAMLR
jgi:hypothetical protein